MSGLGNPVNASLMTDYPRRIILKTDLSPGDLCTLTAAIESLHICYPGKFLTDVRTSCDDLFLYNPRITKLETNQAEVIEIHYTDLINIADDVPNAFLRGYCYDLGKQLNLLLELTTNRPHIYLSIEERQTNPIALAPDVAPWGYWVFVAGVKNDFTLKQWPVEYYQAVVDHFRGKIQFVQIGAAEHDHPTLDGVVNMVGKTDTRRLIQLVYHSRGGLGPVTFLQHLCAALEKPYIALLGGREPVIWTQYPLQTTLHSLGKLPCCRKRSCWRSRVVRLNDGSEQDLSLCDLPILDMVRPVGHCMAMIKPVDIIRTIESYYEDLSRHSTTQKTPNAKLRIDPVVGNNGRNGISVAPTAPAQIPANNRQTESHSDNGIELELVAYSAWGFDVKILPATSKRQWMDATEDGFAYHCLPMVLANQSGWIILAPHGVVAQWNGGLKPEDLKVDVLDSPTNAYALSSVGSGILTWTIPYVFRTPPGWNLLCRGPANYPKDGLCPLEGLVEADWSYASFSMNWKFTRPGICQFNAGEPIAMLVPQRRLELEGFRPRLAELKSNPELEEGYGLWIKSRQEFWAAQKNRSPEVLRQRYQKHYFHGCTNAGIFFPDHQKRRTLASFESAAAGPSAAEQPDAQSDVAKGSLVIKQPEQSANAVERSLQ